MHLHRHTLTFQLIMPLSIHHTIHLPVIYIYIHIVHDKEPKLNNIKNDIHTAMISGSYQCIMNLYGYAISLSGLKTMLHTTQKSQP